VLRRLIVIMMSSAEDLALASIRRVLKLSSTALSELELSSIIVMRKALASLRLVSNKKLSLSVLYSEPALVFLII
jgi:hypothetical protein